MTSSKAKHVFIVPNNDHFTSNLLLNLVDQKVFDFEDILIVVYKRVERYTGASDNFIDARLRCISWEIFAEHGFLDAASLNFLSLHLFNADKILFCIKEKKYPVHKVNIIISDDEVDRWNKLYCSTGELTVNAEALVDEPTLEILGIVDNYICPREPWGNLIEKVAERPLNIIDAVKPFSIFPFEVERELECLCSKDILRRRSNNVQILKAMIGTKSKGSKALYRFVVVLLKLGLKRKLPKDKSYIFGVWASYSLKTAALFFLARRSLSVMGCNVYFEILSTMPPERYFLTLHEYDALFLQARGGVSTAKYFAEKIGDIYLEEETLNFEHFSKVYDYSFPHFKKLEEGIQQFCINEKTITVCNESTKKIAFRHDKSIERLKQLWSENDKNLQAVKESS